MTALKKIDRWVDVALMLETVIVTSLYLMQVLA